MKEMYKKIFKIIKKYDSMENAIADLNGGED